MSQRSRRNAANTSPYPAPTGATPTQPEGSPCGEHQPGEGDRQHQRRQRLGLLHANAGNHTASADRSAAMQLHPAFLVLAPAGVGVRRAAVHASPVLLNLPHHMVLHPGDHLEPPLWHATRVTVPMSLSSWLLRGHYRVTGPTTSRLEQLKVPLDNMHATG